MDTLASVPSVFCRHYYDYFGQRPLPSPPVECRIDLIEIFKSLKHGSNYVNKNIPSKVVTKKLQMHSLLHSSSYVSNEYYEDYFTERAMAFADHS